MHVLKCAFILVSFFFTMLPTSMCLFSHTFFWFHSLFLWVHWISFSSFSFIFPHLILSTRWLYYKLWESCLIRNMLLLLSLPALCTPLDFSDEEERYYTWVQWSLSTVLLLWPIHATNFLFCQIRRVK